MLRRNVLQVLAGLPLLVFGKSPRAEVEPETVFTLGEKKYFTRNGEVFLTIDANGGSRWFSEGLPHREDGPAIIYANGDMQWFRKGLCHRDDGPAIVNIDGGKEWWLNGKRHRDDGPAVEKENVKWWFRDGSPHRVDGPAIERASGTETEV